MKSEPLIFLQRQQPGHVILSVQRDQHHYEKRIGSVVEQPAQCGVAVVATRQRSVDVVADGGEREQPGGGDPGIAHHRPGAGYGADQ